VSSISVWLELQSTWNTSPRDAGKTWEEPDPWLNPGGSA
jgi:hypothetical protein